MIVNPFTFLYNFFFILRDCAVLLYHFLFEEQKIGNWSFIPVFVLGGATFIIILVAKLIKDFVPLV